MRIFLNITFLVYVGFFVVLFFVKNQKEEIANLILSVFTRIVFQILGLFPLIETISKLMVWQRGCFFGPQ